ncbi:porin [Paraburkholderia bannensis]|uniref:porin n=1 Tax=Paraburkholderia bannensis TaxID=765414 RepID=UPI002AB6AA8D|nr:porin [Paraburkholderia bannensis]
MRKRAVALAAVTATASNIVMAQSAVTLYGIVDAGIGYQSSQTSLGSTAGGRSSFKMLNGVWAGSRFGMTGKEDLGAETAAIFTLESGFNSTTGAVAYSGTMFGKQSFIGVTNPHYGTLTFGRQYTPYYTLLFPYAPTKWLGGYAGAHPGDIDSLDTLYRVNNQIVYISPTYRGLTIGGSYAIGGVPGSFDRGSTYNAAVQYTNGTFGIAAGFQRINNSTLGGGAWGSESTANTPGEPAVSAINYGYRNAQAQQRVAVDGAWVFSPSFDVSLSYSNVQYVPGINSGFKDEAIFNTVGGVVHWKPSVTLDIAGGYSYTSASKANGISNSARYHQFSMAQYYAVSKRTGFYFVEGYQRALGQTFNVNASGTTGIIRASASVGDGMNNAPSSSASQFFAALGIIQKF